MYHNDNGKGWWYYALWVDDYRDIVVGDVLSFNAHMLASIPCDGLLLTSDGNVKMDEAALTGEPEPLVKSVEGPDPWIVSGTSAVAGSGHMLVIAVGSSSVSGKRSVKGTSASGS